MAMFLLWVGVIIYLGAALMIVIRAFQVSASWGVAVLLIPGAALFFIIKDWQESKKYMFASLSGMAIFVLGAIVTPRKYDASAVPEPAEAARQEAQTQPQANYASAVSTPSSSYQPSNTYTPPARPATATVAEEEPREWERKTTTEQVFADRDTKTFHAVSCNKKPENGYRIAKSVAKMQGFKETKCP